MLDSNGALKQGMIVTLKGTEVGQQLVDYYKILAMFSKYYNKYWLAGRKSSASASDVGRNSVNGSSKYKDTKVLVGCVNMLFDGLGNSGRFEDDVPVNETDAKQVFHLVNFSDLAAVMAFYNDDDSSE